MAEDILFRNLSGYRRKRRNKPTFNYASKRYDILNTIKKFPETLIFVNNGGIPFFEYYDNNKIDWWIGITGKRKFFVWVQINNENKDITHQFNHRDIKTALEFAVDKNTKNKHALQYAKNIFDGLIRGI